MSSAYPILEIIKEQCGDCFDEIIPGDGFEIMFDKSLRCCVTLRYSDGHLIVDSTNGAGLSWNFQLEDPAGIEAAIALTRRLLNALTGCCHNGA